jgi:hypothetical protein
MARRAGTLSRGEGLINALELLGLIQQRTAQALERDRAERRAAATAILAELAAIRAALDADALIA